MIVYIITKCGRVLTDEVIQRLLEQVALSSVITWKKMTYVYRCGPSVNDPHILSKELEGLEDKYKILYYVSFEDWRLLRNSELKEFLQAIKDSSNKEKSSGEIISMIVSK